MKEHNYKLKVKKSVKGTISWSYTVSADTIDTLKARNEAVKTYIQESVE